MILFFSGIILWALLLIIHIISFDGIMWCLMASMVCGYLGVWYLAITMHKKEDRGA